MRAVSAGGSKSAGATLVEVDYDDVAALRRAREGASCVVTALNGLEPVMIGMHENRLMRLSLPAYRVSFHPIIH